MKKNSQEGFIGDDTGEEKEKRIEIPIKNPNRPERPGPKPDNTEEFKNSLFLRTFEGYTGEVFQEVSDVDTGTSYIIHPDLEGLSQGYTNQRIAFFRDQFGEIQIFCALEFTLKRGTFGGVPFDEFMDRATKEWVLLPDEEHGPVPPKVDLPDPTPFDFSYEEMIEIIFRDHLIDSLDHPVLRKLAERYEKKA